MENKKYYGMYFLEYFSWAAIVSMAPIYFNESVGLSVSQIGMLLSLMPLINLFFQPIWGGIADIFGNRLRILQLLFISTAILSSILGFVNVPWISIILFSLYTIFACGQAPLKDSISMQYIAQSHSASFGNIRAWGAIGFAFGSYGAGFIGQMFGMNFIFYLAALGFLVTLLVSMNIPPVDVSSVKGNYHEALRHLMKNRSYLFILSFSFFIVGSLFATDQFLGLYIRSRGFEVSTVGFLMFVAVIVEIPLIFHSGEIIKKRGHSQLLLFITVVSALRMFLLMFSSGLSHFILAGILRGLAVGTFIPLFVEMISDTVDERLLSSALSFFTAVATGVSVMIFTFGGGFIANHFTYGTLFGFFAVLHLFPFIIWRGYAKLRSA